MGRKEGRTTGVGGRSGDEGMEQREGRAYRAPGKMEGFRVSKTEQNGRVVN